MGSAFRDGVVPDKGRRAVGLSLGLGGKARLTDLEEVPWHAELPGRSCTPPKLAVEYAANFGAPDFQADVCDTM